MWAHGCGRTLPLPPLLLRAAGFIKPPIHARTAHACAVLHANAPFLSQRTLPAAASVFSQPRAAAWYVCTTWRTETLGPRVPLRRAGRPAICPAAPCSIQHLATALYITARASLPVCFSMLCQARMCIPSPYHVVTLTPVAGLGRFCRAATRAATRARTFGNLSAYNGNTGEDTTGLHYAAQGQSESNYEYQNGATPGFEMCFAASTKGAGGPNQRCRGSQPKVPRVPTKTPLESSIKKLNPHVMYDTHYTLG